MDIENENLPARRRVRTNVARIGDGEESVTRRVRRTYLFVGDTNFAEVEVVAHQTLVANPSDPLVATVADRGM